MCTEIVSDIQNNFCTLHDCCPIVLQKEQLLTKIYLYSHYWNNENVTTSLNHRSGNPGYIKEKPILTGVLAYKDIELLKDDQVIQSMTQSDLYIDRGNDEFSQFLTIMTASSDCENTRR